MSNIMNAVRRRQNKAPESITLDEIAVTPTRTTVHPTDVDLISQIGPVTLNVPILSAPMDTVTHHTLAKKLSDAGGAGIITNTPDSNQQLEWLRETLAHSPCLVASPKCLTTEDAIADADDIQKRYGFSTIPVLDKESGKIAGLLFTRDVAIKPHLDNLVSEWMRPIGESLKTVIPDTSFDVVQDRLLNEQQCNVLPVVDIERNLHGIYFKKDVVDVNPSSWRGKPLVGIAVGMNERDIERVREAVGIGAGIIVVDSSHGDCADGVEQTKRLAKIIGDDAALVVGNVADVDGSGFERLALAGAHAVKIGIGSGSICTTSTQTGVGVGMVTALLAAVFAKKKLLGHGYRHSVIADGGIAGPGQMQKALLLGADAVMSGKWMVAASESLSAVERGVDRGLVDYRGMASAGAIEDRIAGLRYDKQKTAPEGMEGYVKHRGPLMSWLPKDLENLRSGIAHTGAQDLMEFQKYGNSSRSWTRWSGVGVGQQHTRVLLDK